MNEPIPAFDPLLARLRQLIARQFRLPPERTGALTDDEPLIGGRLGLDSLDALSLGLQIEDEFGVTIGSATESRAVFASLASLAGFIRQETPDPPATYPPLALAC